MRITEIFGSLQGETTRVGTPTAFVRLSGCNLDCAWCDTRYARRRGSRQSVAAVVERVRGLGLATACVTGGEPLLQPEAPLLMAALQAAGLDVVLMTNGSVSLAEVPEGVHKIIDVKSPWSHLPEAPSPRTRLPDHTPFFLTENLGLIGRSDEVKFVVRNRREFDWAVSWAVRNGLFDRAGAVLAGAAWGTLDPSEVAKWVIRSRLPLRLNFQVHKALWGGKKGR
jgi:7-carboxy-7-deazaguanine synthase